MNDPALPPAAPPPRRPLFSAWGLLVVMGALCVIIPLAAIFGVPWFVALTGGELVKKAERAFGRVLQITPVTTIKGDSVVLEKSAIAELAVAQRKTQVVIKYQTQWLH